MNTILSMTTMLPIVSEGEIDSLNQKECVVYIDFFGGHFEKRPSGFGFKMKLRGPEVFRRHKEGNVG